MATEYNSKGRTTEAVGKKKHRGKAASKNNVKKKMSSKKKGIAAGAFMRSVKSY